MKCAPMRISTTPATIARMPKYSDTALPMVLAVAPRATNTVEKAEHEEDCLGDDLAAVDRVGAAAELFEAYSSKIAEVWWYQRQNAG